MSDPRWIEANARVVAVKGGQAIVRGERGSGCAGCSQPGCGADTVAAALPSTHPLEMTLDDPIGVHPGETVVLGVGSGRVLLLALVAYLFPIAAMAMAAVVSVGLGMAPFYQLVFALGGLFAALAFVRAGVRRHDALANPKILARKSSC